MRGSQTENWKWIKVVGEVTEPGMGKIQVGG